MASTANANIINTSITTPSVTQSSTIHSPGRRVSGSRVMPSSPWTTIVRGESDAVAVTATAIASPSSPLAPSPTAIASTATPEPVVLVASPSSSSMVADDESSDNGNGSNGNAGKRPAWNKPSNGVVEVGPVMGAVSWPALSESTRASGKPSQDSSSKDASSSISVPQGTGSVLSSSSSQKQVAHNADPNLTTPNHTMPARQRSFKHNAGNSNSNGGVSQPTGSSQPQQMAGEMHSNNSSPRDHSQRNSQSQNPNDHPQQQQRNSFRRNNGGPHSRDHHNFGRRDQDRSNQDWNSHRSFNGRDSHMQPQRVVPRFMRHPPPPPPPPSTAPFIGPPPVRAFGNPIGFHELAPPMYYVAGPPPDPLIRAVPFVAPIPHAMYYPAPDTQLHSKIVNQIDYYFSNENLIKDTFLRQNMDDQGFVPVKLIAGFNKVSHLTDNIQFILDAIRNSTIVEVQGDKVRRRNDWMRWMMPSSAQFPNVPSVVRPTHDMLVPGVHSISLEENPNLQSAPRSQTDVHNEEFLGRVPSYGDLNSQSQVSSSAEGAGQVSVQGVSDSSNSARNSSK